MANREKALHITFKKSMRQHKVFAVIDCSVAASSAAEAKRVVADALENIGGKIPGAFAAQIGTRHSGEATNHKRKPKATPRAEHSTRSKADTLDKDDIIKMYKNPNVTLTQIGKKYRISDATIYRYLRLWGAFPKFAPVSDDE